MPTTDMVFFDLIATSKRQDYNVLTNLPLLLTISAATTGGTAIGGKAYHEKSDLGRPICNGGKV
jgi:hypothetical protein